MGKQEKLLKQAKNNPQGLSFDDFKTLLTRCGWIDDHQTGSHSIWYSPGRFRIYPWEMKRLVFRRLDFFAPFLKKDE